MRTFIKSSENTPQLAVGRFITDSCHSERKVYKGILRSMGLRITGK